MPDVRIYRPARTAMQSGRRKTRRWRLEFLARTARNTEPLMGWTASTDTAEQVTLAFPDRASAVRFAETHGWTYEVADPAEAQPGTQTYADNFQPARGPESRRGPPGHDPDGHPARRRDPVG